MVKIPAFQLYTGDWLKDPNLSMCSPATRGIWIDLICAMHELDRCGRVSGTTDQIARLVRCTAVQLVQALDELQMTRAADVTQRKGVYTVINRRMKREHDKRKLESEKKRKQRRKKTMSPSVPKLSPQCPQNVPADDKRGVVPPMSLPSRARLSSSSSSLSNSNELLVKSAADEKLNAKTLLAHFGNKYQNHVGEEYHANFGKDGKLLKGLIDHYGGPKVKGGIDYFFDVYLEDNDFSASNPTVGVFQTVWNAMIAQMKVKNSRDKSLIYMCTNCGGTVLMSPNKKRSASILCPVCTDVTSESWYCLEPITVAMAILKLPNPVASKQPRGRSQSIVEAIENWHDDEK